MEERKYGPILPSMLKKAYNDGLDLKEMMDDQAWLCKELSKWPPEKVMDLAVDMLLWTKYWPNEAFLGSTTSATGHARETVSNSTASGLQNSSAIVETQPFGAVIAASPAASIIQDQGPQSLNRVTFSAKAALLAIKTNGWKGTKRKRVESTANPAQETMGPRQAAAEVGVSNFLDFRHPKRFCSSEVTKRVKTSGNEIEGEKNNDSESGK